MASTIFTTPEGKYSWEIPVNWAEYDDEDAGTYAFFNAVVWSGNLRITPMMLQGTTESYKDKATQLIEEEVEQNENAIKVILGENECAFYKKENIQDEFINYHWITGKADKLFLCSFTIDKDQDNEAQTRNELETIKQIIASIKVS